MYLEATQMIGVDGFGYHGEFQITSNRWNVFRLEPNRLPIEGSSYFTPFLPVDFHRHAVGGIDLSAPEHLDLGAVNHYLNQEQLASVLTVFLTRKDVGPFCEFARSFDQDKRQGKNENILGLAIEGPLLSSPGGTPAECVWQPTRREWQLLAECGAFGLKYIVISPDAICDAASDGQSTSMTWIIESLLDSGISPALGHFLRSDPQSSAVKIRNVLELATRRGPLCPPLLSDHLFNDMPLRVRHAWRTAEEKARRSIDLSAMNIDEWTIDNVSEKLGPVPGMLLRGAHDGLIKLCVNFDGEHVDLNIARQVVRIVGAGNIIVLTDRVDGKRLARQELVESSANKLLYNGNGVVVAGRTSLDEQMTNLRNYGISEEDIWKMVAINPCAALGMEPDADPEGRPQRGCFVDSMRNRHVFDLRAPKFTSGQSRSATATD